jgi:hypothetical protein
MRNLILFLTIFISAQALCSEGFHWRMNDGSKAPNTKSQKSISGFGGWLLVTQDEDWEEKWNTPKDHIPHFSEAQEVELGEELTILPFFANPKLDANKYFNILCDIKIIKPDGSFSINETDIPCAQGALDTDPMSIFLTQTVIKYVGEPGDPFGVWTVFFNLKDTFRNIEIPLETSFKLVKSKTKKSKEPTSNTLID